MARLFVLPSALETASAPGSRLSRLNGWPMLSPTDASSPSSRTPTHGLGSMWIATQRRLEFAPLGLGQFRALALSIWEPPRVTKEVVDTLNHLSENPLIKSVD